MKKSNHEVNSIFSIAEEMIKDNGEDCFYYDAEGDNFIVAALDGCGGSGSKKYENYSGKTGAYVASRAVCGGIKEWYKRSNSKGDLIKYIQGSLAVCKKYADKPSRIMGSLGKAFPTTLAIVTGALEKDRINSMCYWAGDSRCYMLDSDGMHQLTEDDLDGQDAMSNLISDGVMTNVINATTSFELHSKEFRFNYPCVLFAATDGCFGYLNSPMEFEHIILDSLIRATNVKEWQMFLNERIHNVTGDDYTLCCVVCGFKDFDDIKHYFEKRNKYIMEKYICSQENVNNLWETYKKDYSIYI